MIQDQQSLQFLARRRVFTYQTTIVTAATPVVGTQHTGSIRVTDLDFVCSSIRATVRAQATGRQISTDDDDGTSELGGTPDVPFLIQLTETGSQRVLSDQPIDGLAMFAPSGVYELPVPMIIGASTQVQVVASNLKVFAAATILRLSFHGFHLVAG